MTDVNIMRFMKEIGTDLELPDEYRDEIPEEEILHEWDGGVPDEIK